MPKRPKSGPPYTDIPEEPYVVVINPWGMQVNPQSRSQSDFDRIATWAQLVLQQAGLGGGRKATIECIYSMGTRDEIILQFKEGTDIIPLLGEHRWANIAKDWKGPPCDPRSTRVFIYNWRNNGDPANHNWNENYPKCLPLDNVPAKSPYPAPSWTRPPSTLTNFVHPIPHPPVLLAMPNDEHNSGQEQRSPALEPPSSVSPSPTPPVQDGQAESGEQRVAQDPVSTSLFTRCEPPSHARLLGQQEAQHEEASSPRGSPPPPIFIKKFDPYELEEDALNALRPPEPGQEDVKGTASNEDLEPALSLPVKLELAEVKIEDDDAKHNITPGSDSQYRPSQALIDAFDFLTQADQKLLPARQPTCAARRPNMESQTALPASSGYQPSAELTAEVNRFLLGTTATTSSSSESARSGTRKIVIKREYEADPDEVASFARERRRIKIEEY